MQRDKRFYSVITTEHSYYAFIISLSLRAMPLNIIPKLVFTNIAYLKLIFFKVVNHSKLRVLLKVFLINFWVLQRDWFNYPLIVYNFVLITVAIFCNNKMYYFLSNLFSTNAVLNNSRHLITLELFTTMQPMCWECRNDRVVVKVNCLCRFKRRAEKWSAAAALGVWQIN